MKADSSLSALMCWALIRSTLWIGANIRKVKATAHHARSSLRHGHQLEDMAVVVLVIEAAAAIPIVELSVFKAPGPIGAQTAFRDVGPGWRTRASGFPFYLPTPWQ